MWTEDGLFTRWRFWFGFDPRLYWPPTSCYVPNFFHFAFKFLMENRTIFCGKLNKHPSQICPLVSLKLPPPPKFVWDKYLRIARAINRWKKTRIRNLHMDRENEANMMFIIWLPVWENGNKCRKSDLTVIWQASVNESFNWLTKTIAPYKIFPLNVQSKCKWAMLKNSYSFPAGLWKKTLHIAKKLPRKVCPEHCRRNQL